MWIRCRSLNALCEQRKQEMCIGNRSTSCFVFLQITTFRILRPRAAGLFRLSSDCARTYDRLLLGLPPPTASDSAGAANPSLIERTWHTFSPALLSTNYARPSDSHTHTPLHKSLARFTPFKLTPSLSSSGLHTHVHEVGAQAHAFCKVF